MSGRLFDVAILGGGIAGCAAAFNLARRGLSVHLIEKGVVGGGASGANFGGVRQQGRDLAELPLARRSRELWTMLPDLIGTDGGFVASGHLKLAFSDVDMQALQEYADRASTYGLALELIGASRIRSAHPWLGPEVRGASLCAEDGSANPRIVAPAFAQAARRAGAHIAEMTQAVDVARESGHFQIRCSSDAEISATWLVNCAGAWGAAIAERFGEPVPLTPIAPNCMVTEPVPSFLDRAIGICGGGVAIRQTRNGSIVIGGGEAYVDLTAGRARPLASICKQVLQRALRIAPRLSHVNIVRAWAGVEGDMVDHLPALGMSATTPGLIHAFGFSQHGFQLGPAVGEVIADLVTSGEVRVDISGLRIDRPSLH